MDYSTCLEPIFDLTVFRPSAVLRPPAVSDGGATVAGQVPPPGAPNQRLRPRGPAITEAATDQRCTANPNLSGSSRIEFEERGSYATSCAVS